jgi:hypothetical protein
MASTISAGTLKVKIIEEIKLNGKDQGGITSFNIASVNEISKRIVTVPASEIEIIAMSTAVTSGTFIESDVRYIRITNLDDTNHITLTFKDEDNTEFAVLLDKGQSFIYNSDLSAGVVNTMHAGGSALTVSLNDLVNVTALADTAACDVEIFVASV